MIYKSDLKSDKPNPTKEEILNAKMIYHYPKCKDYNPYIIQE